MRIPYVFAGVLLFFTVTTAIAAPSINVWHGTTQSFGQIGNPQTAINILGNVSDGSGIQSLTYKLNGGSAINLSRGPDTRRLLSTGDFNIDINTSSLNNGSNTVLITATNTLSQVSTQTVTVNYTAGQTWPIPYSINWSSAGTIPNVAQVIDGNWTLFGGSIRPTFLGYDRLVGIGNRTWTDYEVTVPITINGIDPGGFNPPSNGPGVGLLLRWPGHTDNPIAGFQPKTGYLPLGAIGWYNWDPTGGGVRLKMHGNNLGLMDEAPFTMTFGVAYNFKMRVLTVPGVGSEYKMRVWQAGQTEPSAWMLEGTQSLSDPLMGSVCLVAHHVNANFGNVTITAIPPPAITNIQAAAGGSTATVTWTTDSPTTSVVMYGLTTAYELGTVSDPSLVTAHSVPLSGLNQSTTYHYKVQSADAQARTTTSSDQTFTTTTLSNVATDQFNQGSLATGLWSFINPLNDATLSMTGSQVSITVPGGGSHDAWFPNNAPRIMQSVTNSNFEVQVKFDSPVNQLYQMEGVLVQQDVDDYIRFDFVSEAGVTRVFAAVFVDGGPSVPINTNIGSSNISPLYLKVKRQGNVWTESYSFNGVNWTAAGSFSHTLTMTGIGLFAGVTGSAPTYTVLADWFGTTEGLPVQLASFTATAISENRVHLNWRTTSETNNYGFYVQKSETDLNNFVTVENSFVPGHGTTITPQSYTFTDVATPGTWLYRLQQVDLDGSEHYSDPVHVSVLTDVHDQGSVPNAYTLEQNYPNPFNPSTVIKFDLPQESRVRLEVYNVIGQRVATLVDAIRPAGSHQVSFNATGLTSGVYIYRISAGAFAAGRKMVVAK